MGTIGNLNYKIGADTSGFTRGMVASKKELRDAAKLMDATRTPTERYSGELGKLNSLYRKGAIDQTTYTRRLRQMRVEKMTGIPVVGRFVNQLANVHPALIAAGLALAAFTGALAIAKRAVRGVTEAIKEQLGNIDEIAKAARSIDMTASELVGLRLAAAEFSGVEGPAFDKAIKKMTVQLGDAQRGTGSAKMALDMLHKSVDDFAGQSPAETFKDLADAIAAVEDPTRRAYIAQQLFGRSGVDLINMLSAGREGIEDVERAAAALGSTFTAIEASNVEAANDAVGRLSERFDGLGRRAAISAAPALKLIADELLDLTDRSSEFGQTIQGAIELIGPGLAITADIVKILVGQLQTAQATVLDYLATALTAAEKLDKLRAKVTGGEADQELAIMADTFRNKAKATRIEGWNRTVSGASFDTLAKFNELQKTGVGLATDKAAAQKKGADLAAVEADALAKAAAEQQKTADAATALTDRLQQQVDLFGLSAGEAAIVTLELQDAAPAATKLARELQATLDTMQGEAALEASIEQFTQSLWDQATAAGKTAEELKFLQLVRDGATEPQLADARMASNLLFLQRELADIAAEQQKIDDAAMKRGEQLTQSLRSPAEQLADDIAEYDALLDEYDDLLAREAITEETHARAVAKAREAITEAVEPVEPVKVRYEVDGVAAAVRDSQEAAKAIARHKRETEQNTTGGIRLTDARKLAGDDVPRAAAPGDDVPPAADFELVGLDDQVRIVESLAAPIRPTFELLGVDQVAADIEAATGQLGNSPDVPKLPDLTTDIAGVPDLPDLAIDEPDVPDLPAIDEPDVPDLPDLTTDIAGVPDLPDLTIDIAGVPDLPDLAIDEPDVPDLPDLAIDEPRDQANAAVIEEQVRITADTAASDPDDGRQAALLDRIATTLDAIEAKTADEPVAVNEVKL